MSTPKTRQRANILITGTPGTGKSTLAARVAQNLNYEFIDIGSVIMENKFYLDYDENYKSHILDEDKLLDYLQDRMDENEGGVVLDYLSSDFFPKRWFDVVIVLRCENTQILYDRLSLRDYEPKKLRENIECEIFGTVAEEAIESYDADVVYQFPSETLEQQAENVKQITEIVAKLKKR